MITYVWLNCFLSIIILLPQHIQDGCFQHKKASACPHWSIFNIPLIVPNERSIPIKAYVHIGIQGQTCMWAHLPQC